MLQLNLVETNSIAWASCACCCDLPGSKFHHSVVHVSNSHGFEMQRVRVRALPWFALDVTATLTYKLSWMERVGERELKITGKERHRAPSLGKGEREPELIDCTCIFCTQLLEYSLLSNDTFHNEPMSQNPISNNEI